MRPRASGFTLIEAMVTVVIFAILTSFTVPSMRSLVVSNRVATTTNELIAAFNLARLEAIKSCNVYFVTYAPVQSGCTGATGNNWLYGLAALSGAPALNNASTNDQNGQLCSGNCGALSLTNITGSPSPAPIKTSDVFIPSLADKCTDGSCSRDELIAAEQCSFVLSIAGASDIYWLC